MARLSISHRKWRSPPTAKAECVIINAVECEPYITADFRLMMEHADEILVGLELLMKGAKVTKGYIGIETNKMPAIELLTKKCAEAFAASEYQVEIRAGASTGGTDYVAALVHRSYPAYSFTHIIFLINTVVAVSSYFVYGWDIEPVILCIIYCYLTTRVSDYIIEGNKEALRIEIITSRPEEICDLLIRELRHTATILRAEGGYSHQEKTVLICVINKHQLTHFYRIIAAFPDAFVSVSSVKETRGNFKKIHESGR